MTQAYANPARRLISLSQPSIFSSLSAITLALFLLSSPEIAQAKNTKDGKTASASRSAKKKGVSKTPPQQSSSEETRAERDRRMYR
ncbi:MAG: hypothetical protein ACK5OA_15835, partial [Acidovorax sp.]